MLSVSRRICISSWMSSREAPNNPLSFFQFVALDILETLALALILNCSLFMYFTLSHSLHSRVATPNLRLFQFSHFTSAQGKSTFAATNKSNRFQLEERFLPSTRPINSQMRACVRLPASSPSIQLHDRFTRAPFSKGAMTEKCRKRYF